MPSSIAKREKLVGPLQLALIAVLFAVSFFFLLPKKDAFTISANSNEVSTEPAIGELDLAYLKARSAAGQTSLDDTSQAVTALVRTGQVDAARELLKERPALAIDEKNRFSLDFEVASAEYFASDSDEQRQIRRLQLLSRIELLLSNPRIRTVAHLQRAAQLTAQLEQTDTSVALYKLLAEEDNDNASQWYEKCAQGLSMQKAFSEAAICYDKAINVSTSQDEIFEFRLAQFSLLSFAQGYRRQDEVVTQLTTHQPLSNLQREKLAVAMLAGQRPAQAYLIYDQLAKYDTPNKAKWLLEAAKWAQASNQGLAAANYIDQASELNSGANKIALLERAEALLVASGENKRALIRIAERIEVEPNDKSLLRDGVVRAQQVGERSTAIRWNQQLLDLDPTDMDAVQTQITLSLANKDLPTAAKWSKYAVRLLPGDRDARLKLAQVSEWNGEPIAAQREWEWLVEHYPEVENLKQLVRLATLNMESGVAANAMRKLLNQSPNDKLLIARLIELYELEGAPVTAASMLIEQQSVAGVQPYTQRELARLYQRHILYPEALSAWHVYATRFGRNTEETLNRMELHWRLNQPAESAEIARHLIGTTHASEAGAYQVNLISEIAWRYRIPELAELVRPHLATIKDEFQSQMLGKRLVQSLEDAGKDEEAIAEATRLWQSTRSNEVAFTAMNLAFKTGKTDSVQILLEDNQQTANLRKNAAYWNLAASIHQKNGEPNAAVAAFKQALLIEPKNAAALSGLLWSYINVQDANAIAIFIEQHQSTAETEPQLWSAFAIAHLQLGLPELSLTWFDRQLDRIEADYNMLLTFADALEYAGRAEPARKVRLYAIKRLRPVLAEGASTDQSELIRQYSQLLNRYGSAEDKERLALAMLDDAAKQSKPGQFWREDIAISWLMATQRHEHARVIMAKLHDQRLKTPAWQTLSVAMAANDLGQIQQVLNGTGSVSIGNHILALRQLGHDKKAYALARDAVNRAPTLTDRDIARSQYGAMRSERPSFSAGNYKQTTMNGLGISETGFTLWHSFNVWNIGFSVDYKGQQFSSDTFILDDSDERQDIAFTLHHGDRRFGGELTAGYNANAKDGIAYALAKQHIASVDGKRRLSAELVYNEPSTASALLRLTAKQNRMTIGYEQALGFREYVKFQANVSDINTRVQQKRIALGLAGRVEFGIRGAFGSNVWSTNIAANRNEYDLASNLPSELAVSSTTTINSILTKESTSLTFGASLSRGGVQGGYPQTSSPRYYLNANVGHVWPQATFGAQFDGGAGIRILGGDELSIGFTHDTQSLEQLGDGNDSTSIGLNYRYHF